MEPLGKESGGEKVAALAISVYARSAILLCRAILNTRSIFTDDTISWETAVFARLFLLFTLVPIIELYLLIKVGSIIGPWPTIALVIGTGIVGAYLIRLQGFYVLHRVYQEVARGRFPADPLIEGFLLVIAGALLISPGILTDITGILILLPSLRFRLRNWVKRKIRDYIRRKFSR